MSEPEIVHPVPVEAAEPWLRNLRVALFHDPAEPDMAARDHNSRMTWSPDRAWGVRAGGRWVGTLATEPRTVSVPDGGTGTNDVAVDALTRVSVAATHRRRGLLRRMLSDSLAAAHARGDAMSALIAAEWPIYGRFGYAPATFSCDYRYHPRRPGAAPDGDQRRMREVTPDELAAIAPGVSDAARQARAGQMDRHDPWWPRHLGVDGFQAVPKPPIHIVHDGDDGVDGVLSYRVAGDFDLDGTYGAIEVDDLVTATDQAYRDLWAFLAGIDIVGEIKMAGRPVDEPIRWLLGDGRALAKVNEYDALWLRLLDLPKALEARGYATDGQIVLEVIDTDDGGYAAGRVSLEVVGGHATCTPTSEAAGLRLEQRTLASAYLGGRRLRQLTHTRTIAELEPGALALADLMFSTPLPPWNQTGF